MNAINKLRNRKAVSPVIATVVLVAVTITVAVATAYWMGNIAGTYTASEKIEMPTSYAVYYKDLKPLVTDDQPGWKIFIGLKNSGSRDATVTNLFLNEKPLKDYGESVELFVADDSGGTGTGLVLSDIAVPVPKGDEVELILWIYSVTEGCSPGTTVDLKINSAAGNTYPVLVRLP